MAFHVLPAAVFRLGLVNWTFPDDQLISMGGHISSACIGDPRLITCRLHVAIIDSKLDCIVLLTRFLQRFRFLLCCTLFNYN